MSSITIQDIRSFYSSHLGRMTRRLIDKKIKDIWPDLTGMDVVTLGYATPYMGDMIDQAASCIAFMPPSLGVHQWPRVNNNKPSQHHNNNSRSSSRVNTTKRGKGNVVAICNDDELPLAANSVDRVILIHSAEYAHSLEITLQEIWRVLKSNGRLLIIVPNRLGIWARSENTPFGHGRPYSHLQILHSLKENLFVHERSDQALFTPPIKSSVLYHMFGFLERIGPYIGAVFTGLLIVESTKQIYAGIPQHALSFRQKKQRKWAVKPAAQRKSQTS